MAWQYLSLMRLQLIAPGCLSLGEQHLMLAEGLKSRSNTLFLLPFGFCPCAAQGLKGGCSPRFRADSQSMLVSHGLACQKHVFRSDAAAVAGVMVAAQRRSLTLAADLSLVARSGVKSCRTSDVASVEWTSERQQKRSGTALAVCQPEGSAPGMLEAEVSVHDHLEQP